MEVTQKLIICAIENEEYGFPIECVQSIEKNQRITRIPNNSSEILGMIDYRSTLLPVIDLENLLYQDKVATVTAQTKIIVTTTSKGMLGFLVPDTKEMVDIPTEKITDIPEIVGNHAPYIKKIASESNRLITLIDPEYLVLSVNGLESAHQYIEQLEHI